MVELQLFADVVVPFLLHFEIESVLSLVIIPLFNLQVLLHCSVEGLRHEVLKVAVEIVFLGIYPA